MKRMGCTRIVVQRQLPEDRDGKKYLLVVPMNSRQKLIVDGRARCDQHPNDQLRVAVLSGLTASREAGTRRQGRSRE